MSLKNLSVRKKIPKIYKSKLLNQKVNKIFRRSIFTTKDIKKGQKFTKDNVRVIRPGHGLEPKYFNRILNKKSPKNIDKHEPLKSAILKNLY